MTHIYKRIHLWVFILSVSYLQAQQMPNISFFRHNWTQINPAAFPREYLEWSDITLFTNLNAKSQRHTVIKGAPKSVDARAELVFGNQYYTNSKLAIHMQAQEAGAIRDINTELGYAWISALKIKDYNIGYFSLGGSVNYWNKQIKIDDVLWQTMPMLPQRLNDNFVTFNIGGCYYFGGGLKKDNTFMNQIKKKTYQNNMGFVGISWSNAKILGNSQYLKPQNYLNLLVGGVIKQFEPTLWVRWMPQIEYETWGYRIPLSAEFNTRFVHQLDVSENRKLAGNQIWLGVGTNTAATLNLETGYRAWWQKNRAKNAKFIQVAFAYTGIRLSSNAIPRPNDFELNIAWNMAK